MPRYSVTLIRKRGTDMAAVRSVDYVSHENKDMLRPFNCEMLVGTHIPEQYWRDAGALSALLLESLEMDSLCLWLSDDSSQWLADAELHRRQKRGSGATPVDALVNLIRKIYAY